MSDMRLYLAGDSGGTKSDFLIFNGDGEIIKTFQTPGLGMAQPGMLDKQAATQAIARELSGKISGCYLSLGGPNGDEVHQLLTSVMPDTPVKVEREANGNMILAVAGIWNCQAAVLVGTGSTAVGEIDGRRVCGGGWGPVYGDDGAGGGMGFQALKTVLRSLDGMAVAGRLPELFTALTSGLNLQDFDGRMTLKQRALAMSRKELAALVPGIARLASEGDAPAAALVGRAAEETAMLAASVTAPGSRSRILGCGGIFRLGEQFRVSCRRRLGELRPGCSWQFLPAFSPVRGAMLRLAGLADLPVAYSQAVRFIKEES